MPSTAIPMVSSFQQHLPGSKPRPAWPECWRRGGVLSGLKEQPGHPKTEGTKPSIFLFNSLAGEPPASSSGAAEGQGNEHGRCELSGPAEE